MLTLLVFAGWLLAQPGETERVVRGELLRIYPDSHEMVVRDFGGGDLAFRLADDVKVTINNRPARIADLHELMNVQVRYDLGSPLPVARQVSDMARVMFSQRVERRPGGDDQTSAVLRVFYGTDRAHNVPTPAWSFVMTYYGWPLAAAVVTVLLMVVARKRGRPVFNWLTVLCCMAVAVLTYRALTQALAAPGGTVPLDELYGNSRGAGIEYGACTVSIPREHKLGRVESPSILKLEFRFDPAKHVTLQAVDHLKRDAFAAELKAVLDRSVRKEALVFVHGYNVSFSEAARRTAQLAYDLEFDGPALFFSWPSQGGLLQYTVDESNVEWASTDIADFLHDVALRSGARRLHLLAHSMGNRAVTTALGDLAGRPGHRPEVFREVVLAAPDVDAAVFQRRLFPAMQKAARRVTLYASSNDNALRASKTVHGSARAGDSMPNLVVLPGLDTIDVSTVDTSLLGHSYYGDSKSIITDLHRLLDRGDPPQQRPWLKSAERGPLKYWLFRPEADEPF